VILADVLSLGELKVGIAGFVEFGIAIGAPPAETGGLARLLVVGISSPSHSCFLSSIQEPRLRTSFFVRALRLPQYILESINDPALLAIAEGALLIEGADVTAADLAFLVARQPVGQVRRPI